MTHYPDAQLKGTHLDPACNIQKYSTDQLTAYWAMIYTIAVIAGVTGDDDERKAARKAIEDALKDAADVVGSYGKAAQIVADDYVVPHIPGAVYHPLTATSEGAWTRAQIARGIESFFGADTKDNDARIEELDQQIRDKTAVRVNRQAGAVKTVKGWLGKDTSAEDATIAETAATVKARQDEVRAAFDRLWNGLKDIALARYNQFTKERNQCGVGYALQTLGVDGGFLVVETVVTVAAGAATAGAGAVALRVAVTAGKTAGKIVVKISRAGRAVSHSGPNEGVLNLDEAKVVKFGKAHNGYGDDLGGHPNTKADVKPGGPGGRPSSEGEASNKDGRNEAGAYTDAQLKTAQENGIDPKWVNKEGKIIWPSNDGFDGPSTAQTLQPGARIDRYGTNPKGTFFAEPGTPFANRAMPGTSPRDAYAVYEVVKPIPVQAGRIAPWFDQPGGGMQFKTQEGVQTLLDNGFLRKTDAPFR